MEGVEKRKRLEDGKLVDDAKMVKGSSDSKVEEKKKKVHDEDNDGEVEEFFAILKRIHVAVKYFENGHGGDRRKTMARLWNPHFERDDFEGIKIEKGSETVSDTSGLDLNAEPDTE